MKGQYYADTGNARPGTDAELNAARSAAQKAGATKVAGNDTAVLDWFKDPSNPYSSYYKGAPPAPAYVPGYDISMATLPDVEKRLSALTMDTRGLDALRNESLRPNSSPWAFLERKKFFEEETGQRERAKQEARGNQAEAETRLAMSGGLSSGARERLASQGARNALAMSQEAGRSGTINRLGVDVQDAQNRMQSLRSLPGAENQSFQTQLQKENMWDQAKQSDLQNLVSENARRNTYNQNLYDSQMTAFAANQTADAQKNSGGGGSFFICTELNRRGLMSDRETVRLHKLFWKACFTHADFISWYLKYAGEAVETMKERYSPTVWGLANRRCNLEVQKELDLHGENAAMRKYALAAKAHMSGVIDDLPWKNSYLETGFLKSFLALPSLLIRPAIYRFAWGKLTRSFKKKRFVPFPTLLRRF